MQYDITTIKVDLCMDSNKEFFYRFTPNFGTIRTDRIQDYFIIWMVPYADKDLAIRYGELDSPTLGNEMPIDRRGTPPVLSWRNVGSHPSNHPLTLF